MTKFSVETLLKECIDHGYRVESHGVCVGVNHDKRHVKLSPHPAYREALLRIDDAICSAIVNADDDTALRRIKSMLEITILSLE